MTNKKLLICLLGKIKENNWKIELSRLLDDAECTVSEIAVEHKNSYVLETTKIHKLSTNKSGKKTFGFDSLINELELISVTEDVWWISIFSKKWVGRSILTKDLRRLIGCAFVEKKESTSLRTPPNWDGSKEMLEAYNSGIKSEPPLGS